MTRLIAVGLMTGTSMDGIDGAIISTDGRTYTEHLGGVSIKYEPGLHMALRAAEYALQQRSGNLKLAEQNFAQHLKQYLPNDFLKAEIQLALGLRCNQDITIAAIIKTLTLLHSNIVEQLLIQSSLSANQVDVIGFHGQNLYHNAQQKITIQIGDPQLLALKTGIFVISDFRANDLKHGGQGAPLAPLYHYVLALAKGVLPIAIVNCGGIANVTIIANANIDSIVSFDTGPGNILIDRYIRESTTNKEFLDLNGKYGKQGKLNHELLNILQQTVFNDPNFLRKPPPKCLDASNFQLPNSINSFEFVDACNTLEAFTAQCIANSMELISPTIPNTWVLVGGGWKNPIITNYLQQFLQTKVVDLKINHADDLGWNNQYIEAEIFAYLATRSLQKLPLSLPNTTGVTLPTLGGHGYLSETMTKKVTNLLQENPEILHGYA